MLMVQSTHNHYCSVTGYIPESSDSHGTRILNQMENNSTILSKTVVHVNLESLCNCEILEPIEPFILAILEIKI